MTDLSPARRARREDWPAVLRSHALRPPPPPEPAAVLRAFRTSNAFYAARLRDVADWAAVPPLTKAELTAVPVAATERHYEMRTSGTSGQQALVHCSQSEGRFRQALSYRPLLFCQLPAVVRQVIFRDGAEIEAPGRQQFPFRYGGSVYLTWRVGIAASAPAIAALLRAVRPHLVRGLTSGIVRFVEQAPDRLDGLGVQWLSTSGEFMRPEWRVTLERAFGARVLDRYGSTETGSLAWQCPWCAGYHANTDEQLLEPRPDGLLVTPLFMRTQPLLRYRLNDVVEWAAAPSGCRLGLPVLHIAAARRDDWLIDGAGNKVSPLSLQFEQIVGLQRWRLHQRASGELDLYVDGELDTASRAQLLNQLRAAIPGREPRLAGATVQAPTDSKFKRVSSALRDAAAH